MASGLSRMLRQDLVSSGVAGWWLLLLKAPRERIAQGTWLLYQRNGTPKDVGSFAYRQARPCSSSMSSATGRPSSEFMIQCLNYTLS
jgi:hypothetical protein